MNLNFKFFKFICYWKKHSYFSKSITFIILNYTNFWMLMIKDKEENPQRIKEIGIYLNDFYFLNKYGIYFYIKARTSKEIIV